jgi:dynein heavy chain
MDIVLFEEAITYTCRIHRIIKLSKGHGMLVGEGGSGRHSLTKLAAYIAKY